MAHNNIEQLKILIKLLDKVENDIYLHIDKKSSINEKEFCSFVSKAKIHIYKKYTVYHADITQTKCQLFLLREAIKVYHDYYHFISGQDMPIKKHEELLAFFKKNKGKEFIHFEEDGYCNKDNCKYYHLFFGIINKYPNSIISRICKRLDLISLNIQKRIKINRKFYCGANWFSITHSLAEDYCMYHKEIIKKVKWTISSDEYVLQTYYRIYRKKDFPLYSNTKDDYDYSGLARMIDWKRGNPYTYRIGDYEELINSSNRMFARKFDYNVDKDIIYRIKEYIEK